MSNTTQTIVKNVAESVRVGQDKRVGVMPQQAFGNAFRVVLNVPGYLGATYVEGIAVAENGMCLEYGWVEKDGQIIDPTLPHDNFVYFSGLRFAGIKSISDAMLNVPKERGCEDLPIFYRFGWGGRNSPELQQAWKDALAYSSSLAK